MKKGEILTILTLILFAFSTISGCALTINLFVEGTFENIVTESSQVKAKYSIMAISQEEYEDANGINVIKNDSKKEGNKIWYRFELFFYDENQEEYVQVEISNMSRQRPDQPSYYYRGFMKYRIGEEEKREILEFNNHGSYTTIEYTTENEGYKMLRFQTK